jgi:membrane-bound lytic murein transglycosylase B
MLAVASALAPASAEPASSPTPRFDLSRTEIKSFIDDVANRNAISRKKIASLLGKAEPQPKIIDLMNRPAERVLAWWEYRARYVNERRIREGAQFWQDHRELLERVQSERGVPAEYLVAIMGVETIYGAVTGQNRVLDALATLAFDYPPRSAYFRTELEQFLLLTREEAIDPLTATGSYAGAMGVPQFMPSSYRRFAVDGNQDKNRNLWLDWDDIVASIANYFRENGWEPGGPVLVDAELDPDPPFQIEPRNLELNQTLDSLNALGVRTRSDAPSTTPVMLVSAEEQDGPAYRVGFRNFQVITRYNRSPRYAMAVHDLAQAIVERVKQNEQRQP